MMALILAWMSLLPKMRQTEAQRSIDYLLHFRRNLPFSSEIRALSLGDQQTVGVLADLNIPLGVGKQFPSLRAMAA